MPCSEALIWRDHVHICVLCSAIASPSLLSSSPIRVNLNMDQPSHDWGSQREGKGQDKACWEVDSIVSGSYDGNTFVKRVPDHMSSQDEPIGGNPPTYGDLFRGKTRDGPLGHLGRPPEPKSSEVATPQVSSVVQVPGKAKAESDDCLKIQALRARLKQKYGDTFFSGKL